jgi:hypothetical protein
MAKDTFDLVLRVPAKNVGEVAQRVLNGKPAVVEDYDKRLADNYGAEGSIEVVEVLERSRSVVVRVKGPDVRVNVVSRAVASVVGSDLGVSYPEWG